MLSYGFGQPTLLFADAPLVTQEIHYHTDEASEVFLLWGINNWQVVPEVTRPAGTVVKDGLMHTPLSRTGNTFIAKVQAPAGTMIDYFFLVTKTPSGVAVEVWDTNGAPKQGYHTVAKADGVVGVQATPQIVHQQVIGRFDVGLQWRGFLILLVGIALVVGIGAMQTGVIVESYPGQSLSRSTLPTFTWRSLLMHGSLLVGTALVIAAITFFYVSREDTFYYWDFASYHDMTMDKAIAFREASMRSVQDVVKELMAIRQSTWKEYSDLHTLLIIPFVLIFGDSRLIYILALALVYLLPFTLVTGAIAVKLVPAAPRVVFWSAVVITLCVPAVWLPTLRGYPDTGSAAFIGLAVLIYLHDPSLKRWWQIGLIGTCLALAVLFRRHFAYDGITFFACISLQILFTAGMQMRRQPGQILRHLFWLALRIGLLAGATLVVLAILGWPFIARVTSTNFGELYASYQVPIHTSLAYYQSYYGWLACILALVGLGMGLWTQTLTRPAASFVLLFAGFSLLQWVLTVKQLGVHYTLHFTMWLVLGLIAFGWLVWNKLRGHTRTVILSLSGGYLLFNLVIALAPVDLFSPLSPGSTGPGQVVRQLFSERFPPFQSQDYTEISRLVEYLRTVSADTDPIYVAASSSVISDDLLWHADRTLYEPVMSYTHQEFWQSRHLNILHWVPFADSRDTYPLEKLLKARYVVVATPFQFHMRPEEQDVMKVVVAAFTEQWEFAQDFTRLPEQFSLADGVTVTIYQRVRPTSLPTAIRTLQAMQTYVGERPGGQLDWMDLNESLDNFITKNENATYRLDSAVTSTPFTLSFLHLDQLTDQTLISGHLVFSNEQCGRLKVRLDALDGEGTVVNTTQITPQPTDAQDFSLSLETQDAAYLLFVLSSEGGSRYHFTEPCWVGVHNLAVSVP